MSLLTRVLADDPTGGGGVIDATVKTFTFTNVSSIADILGLAINIVLGVGVALTIVFLILGGIQYMTAKGDQKAAQEARAALTNAVIGFVVVVGAFTIKLVISNVVGIGTDISITNVTPTGF